MSAPAAGEGPGHLDESADGHAPRLERGGEQRAAVDPGHRTHAGHPVPGAVEALEHVVREADVHEPHAGHHGDVAEHEVDERRQAPRLDHRGVVAQHGAGGAAGPGTDVDALDLSDDARRQVGGVGERLRDLHRLLQGNRGGDGVPGRSPASWRS